MLGSAPVENSSGPDGAMDKVGFVCAIVGVGKFVCKGVGCVCADVAGVGVVGCVVADGSEVVEEARTGELPRMGLGGCAGADSKPGALELRKRDEEEGLDSGGASKLVSLSESALCFMGV